MISVPIIFGNRIFSFQFSTQDFYQITKVEVEGICYFILLGEFAGKVCSR